MSGLDILLDVAMDRGKGADLLFGHTDSNLRVYLEPGDTPLPTAPVSLVRLEPNRRFAAVMFGRTLLIIGLIGGSDSTPVGTVVSFATPNLPLGYLLCDGRAVSRTSYADLFALIGTTFGAGDGLTTFNLPDLRGRVVAGLDSTQAEFVTLGKVGGEKAHALTAAENGPHSHNLRVDTGTASGSLAAAKMSWGTPYPDSAVDGNTVRPDGLGTAHNNLQPYIAMNVAVRC